MVRLSHSCAISNLPTPAHAQQQHALNAEAKHSVAISAMGNYHEALMKREGTIATTFLYAVVHREHWLTMCMTVLRPIDEEEAKKQRPIFGNPYRTERKPSELGGGLRSRARRYVASLTRSLARTLWNNSSCVFRPGGPQVSSREGGAPGSPQSSPPASPLRDGSAMPVDELEEAGQQDMPYDQQPNSASPDTTLWGADTTTAAVEQSTAESLPPQPAQMPVPHVTQERVAAPVTLHTRSLRLYSYGNRGAIAAANASAKLAIIKELRKPNASIGNLRAVIAQLLGPENVRARIVDDIVTQATLYRKPAQLVKQLSLAINS